MSTAITFSAQQDCRFLYVLVDSLYVGNLSKYGLIDISTNSSSHVLFGATSNEGNTVMVIFCSTHYADFPDTLQDVLIHIDAIFNRNLRAICHRGPDLMSLQLSADWVIVVFSLDL